MKFDEVLSHVGEFGFYQKRLFYLLCIPSMLGGLGGLASIFLMDIPPHRCSLGDNDTYALQDSSHSHLINMSIPWETYRGEPVLSSCLKYQRVGNDSHVLNKTVKCDSWVFDKSTFKTTLTEKYGIVCDNKILRSHSNMIGSAGSMVGTIVMGIASDVFGRRPIFLINTILTGALGIIVAFAPNMYVYMGLNFIGAISGLASFQTSYVLVMELVGPSHRVFTGMMMQFAWVIGLLTLGLLAYLIRYRLTLQLVTAAPMILFVAMYWILPESPRWLMSRGRNEEAKAIIKTLAAVNGKTVPPEMLEKITFDEPETQVKVTQMFKSRTLLVIVLIMFFNWFATSTVYYGVTLDVQNLSGNIYLNFTISNIVEFASYVMCVLLLDRLGRKAIHCFCMFTGGIACLSTILPVVYGTSAIDWVTILLSMFGRFGAAGVFAVLYLYTSELFPTVVRNSGVGMSSFCGRVGGMIAPYISDLGILVGGDLKLALPLITFGALSVVAGTLSLFLPETLGRKLPETIQDAKNLRKSSAKTKYHLEGTSSKESKGDVKLNSVEYISNGKL